MIKVGDKMYSFVALLFVFLSLLGYQLATTLLLPVSSNVTRTSQMVTYPYRALLFVLAFFLIIASPKTRQYKENNTVVTIYVLFMFIYFIRILIDIFIRHIYIQPGFQTTIIQYMFISMIPSIWAIKRCALHIDYERLLRWLMIGGCILLGITIMNQNALIASDYDKTTRGQGNIALDSIDFGHTCVSIFIIFLSWLTCHKKGKRIWKVFLILMMAISMVLMLRAASRGPLVALFVVLCLLMFSRMKNKVFGVVIMLIFILVIWFNLSTIIHWLGSISPAMEQRMAATMYENDSSGRDVIYKQAFDIFFQNPIIGKQFVLNSGIYSHNSILDVLIGLGIFGALAWIYLICQVVKWAYRNIIYKTSLMVIGLLSVQFILKGFLSGAMYLDYYLAICIMIVLSVKDSKTN